MEYQDFIKLLEDLKTGGFAYNDADICRKVGCTKAFLSEMKNGKRVVTQQFVTRLRRTFPEYFGTAEQNDTPSDQSQIVEVLKTQVERKDEEIDRLLSVIEALSGAQQKGVAAAAS